MIRKVLATLITFIITISMIAYADSSYIKDLDKSSSYAIPSITYLMQEGIVKGDQNGYFNPKNPITRAEMVTLLVRVMNINTSSVITKSTFKDVGTNNWASKYVEAAYKEGIVTGVSSTEFKPNDIVTREQMAVMFIRALKLIEKDTTVELININAFEDRNKISPWAQKEVEIAIEAGLMNGVSSSMFNPQNQANREQAAVVIERLMKNKDEINLKFKGPEIDSQSIKLSLNNESIILKNKVIIKDNKLFLPVEYLNKFIIGMNASSQKEDATVIEIMPSSEYRDSNTESIWYKIGDTIAYTNATKDPFDGENTDTGTKIVLDTAPVQMDGIAYIPAKELFNILGITYSYDGISNEVIINDNSIGENPNLNYALKHLAYDDNIGELRSFTIQETVDAKTKEVTTRTNVLNRKKRNDNATSLYQKIVTSKTGLPTKNNEYNRIVVDGKLYSKDSPETKWTQSAYYNDKPIDFYTVFYDTKFDVGYVRSNDMNQILYRNFHRIEAKNAGTVNISGITATKYVMVFDIDTVKNTMTDQEYNTVTRKWADTDPNAKLNYVYEFYVAQGKIIKQTFKLDLNMTAINTGNETSYMTSTNVYYKNIGTNPVITAPAASEIK